MKKQNKPIPLAGTSLVKGRNRTSSAFTLVELIIVITILAILATIGFMSYQSYIADARDANRTTSIKSAQDWLEIYIVKNASYPSPDNYAILSSWATLWFQWYAWVSVLSSLRSWDSFQDSTDKQYYTYSVDINKTKYQLLAMLELNTTSYNDLINHTYAIDYTNRYVYTLWTGFWVYLSWSTKIPVQELNSWTTVAVNTANIIVVTSNSIYNNITTYTAWCDSPDIIIGTYIISACNIWTTISGTWINSYGKFFQWGENVAWDSSSFVWIWNNCIWDRDIQACSSNQTWQPTSWLASVSDNISWGVDRWYDWSTSDTRWPCTYWYHVPTLSDWSNIVTLWWWWTNGISMQNALKLPFAWWRYWPDGSIYYPSSALYWMSTVYSTTWARNFNITTWNISLADYNIRPWAFPIRCIKN